MNLSTFTYELPEGLIAQLPIEPRSNANLMVVDRRSEKIGHKKVANLVELLGENDVLIFNDTKVFPARLNGIKETGGKVELLLVKQKGSCEWEVISRPGLKVGQRLMFGSLIAMVLSRDDESAIVQFNCSGAFLHEKIIEIGKTPLPPYINTEIKEKNLRKIYQNVFAKIEGSIAAPTAGFHFDNEMLVKLKNRGVGLEFVTLHVGLGTFRPVKTEKIEDHLMHEEEYFLSTEVAERLNSAKMMGKRIVSVGTTATRVLESCVGDGDLLVPGSGSTKLYVYPPYKFRFIDSMITNFHLPKSTLLMLISAFVSSPNSERDFVDFKSSLVGKAYAEAIERGYRFFSFGDAMMIV